MNEERAEPHGEEEEEVAPDELLSLLVDQRVNKGGQGGRVDEPEPPMLVRSVGMQEKGMSVRCSNASSSGPTICQRPFHDECTPFSVEIPKFSNGQREQCLEGN